MMREQHRQITFATLALGFACGLALNLSACRGSEPDLDHCARRTGNADCFEKFGDERPYCMMCEEPALYNDGCVAEEPTNLECYSPCGDIMNFNEDASCLAPGDGDGDGDMTGDGDGDGDMTGDGDGEPMLCMGDEDCTDPSNPFCNLNSGECVPCDALPNSDELCASLGDGSAPVCVEGACVECAEGKEDGCEGLTPVCDTVANACVPCDDHDQCPDNACNLAAGNCIDPGSILHIDGDNPDCAGADGSEGSPYCDIGDALANAPAEPLLVVHERDLDAPYVEANLLGGSLAIFAASGEEPLLQGVNNSSPLTVSPSGNLFMRGIRIANTPTSPGLTVNGSAWVDSCKVVNNSGGGIVVDSSGSLVLENSFVGGNVDDVHVVEVVDGAATIFYSTLAGGDDFGATASALTCSDGANTVVRNSILVTASPSPEIACSGATITNNAIESDLADNVALGDVAPGWFVSYANGDFHLSGAHPAPIETAATWAEGDPADDIDGDPRPATDGSPDVAGADVP